MNFSTLIAYLIAIAIPTLTIYLFYAFDLYGTGRISTVLVSFGWGVVGAFGIANLTYRLLLGGIEFTQLTTLFAPTLEEMLKSFVLIYLVFQPRFRYIVDGTIYGIAVGIGFAMSETAFIYLPDAGNAALSTAISRVLSTSLMHATASAMVGIMFGRYRRATSQNKRLFPFMGLVLAILVHTIYNVGLTQIEDYSAGRFLLLFAITLGFSGSALIALVMNQGLQEEKRRFEQTLGLDVGVSEGERKAVQRLGGNGIEQILNEMKEFFGQENIALIRRLLVVQANMGILQNNLKSQVSDRLKRAWQEEIAEYQRENDEIRTQLGVYVTSFMRRVFPAEDQTLWDTVNSELANYDPTLVHTFDMFMRVSELAETFTVDQLSAMAERLSHMEIFRNVSLTNLENLCRAIVVENYSDGSVIFDLGDMGDSMYMIESGRINAYLTSNKDSEEKFLRSFRAGDVVGEFSLLDGQPRSARALAMGDVKVLVLQRQAFMMFVQSRPQVVLAMLQYLADKLRYTTASVEASTSWATRIAQGNYDDPYIFNPPVSNLPVPDDPPPALEPNDLSEDTPVIIGALLVRAASVLKERERTLRKRISDTWKRVTINEQT
ncbi:MAG: PrsW family intramembrane metalloprotease [Chloroflexi bacterium]|nr:PrsW family intramembrane metalloprotease [Chloroflexota bacterium]